MPRQQQPWPKPHSGDRSRQHHLQSWRCGRALKVCAEAEQVLHIWQRLESPYLDAPPPPQKPPPAPYRPLATLAFSGAGPAAAAAADAASAATGEAAARTQQQQQQQQQWQQQQWQQQQRQQQQWQSQQQAQVPRLVVGGPSIAVAAANSLSMGDVAAMPLQLLPLASAQAQAGQQQQQLFQQQQAFQQLTPAPAPPPQPAVPYKKQRHAGGTKVGRRLRGTLHWSRPAAS